MLTCELHCGLQVILLGISEPLVGPYQQGQIPETLASDIAEMLTFNTVHEIHCNSEFHMVLCVHF